MPASSTARRGRRPDPALHEQWRQRLARFDSSGLSVTAFCAREGVPLPSFYAWRRRLNGSTVRPQTADLDTPTVQAPFVPVRIREAASVELHLPGGTTLRLTPGCDLGFVRSLVAALGEPSC
jgi:transposase